MSLAMDYDQRLKGGLAALRSAEGKMRQDVRYSKILIMTFSERDSKVGELAGTSKILALSCLDRNSATSVLCMG